tara:strand:- start:2686 stop:3654 length:969 start_codon:yes stop_codon:yes gene_type:complete
MVGKLTPDNIVTASRVPALLGLSPYETQNELLRKCIAAENGDPAPRFEQNEAMAWGDRLEPTILETAAERLGLVDTNLFIEDADWHPYLNFACSLDGIGKARLDGATITTDPDNGIYVIGSDEVHAEGWGVLEAKLTSSRPEERPAPHRGPLQLQGQMMITGLDWGAVCVLYRGVELRVFVYQRDDELCKRIADAIDEFEIRKRDGDYYPLVSSDDGNVAYPEVDDGADVVNLNNIDGAAEAAELLVRAREDVKAAEEIINEQEAILKEAMGLHEKAEASVGNRVVEVNWPMRSYKAQPQKVTPAKEARVIRLNKLQIKERD